MYQMLEETVAYKVTWLQCDTDSKVIHYRLVLYENQQELEADHLNSELKREIILSPNEHHVILRNLHFAMSYHLELACKVEIEDSAVYSDETTLTFKTPPEPPVFQTSQFTTETYEYAKLKFVENHSPALVKSIQIENPNFQDGSLKAMVYWTVSLNSTDDNNTIKGNSPSFTGFASNFYIFIFELFIMIYQS